MSYFHTIRALSIALVVWFCRIHSLFAVEVNSGSGATFNTNDNIASIVSRWTSGWPASGIDGWSYVGSMNGASGVYLGNGWVLTAGHVGSGNFTLGGNTYNYAGYSYTGFTYTTNGTNYPVDLNLFQISTTSTTGNTITLPNVTIATRAPRLFSQVVMIGYGGGTKAWGANYINVTNIPIPVTVAGTIYNSIDFGTGYGSAYNNYGFFIGGDSGGGAFLYTNSQWQLAGINEAVDPTTSNSFMVQLSTYASAISNVITTVPSALSYTPSTVSGMVGTPISSMIPTVNGTVSIYSVNPTLPLGLSLNTSSGVISGTPSVSSASSSYTITATNSYGWTTASVTIAIAAAPTPTPTPSPTPSATPTPSPTATPSPMPTASSSPAPAAPVSDEPTMPEWALILLAVLLAGYVLRATSRGTGHS